MADRRVALEVINVEVRNCQRCGELAAGRTQTVFGVGSLSPRLCFFGEAPGADEDRLGMPFVGRAGQLLDKIIEAMGLQRDDVYILNVLKCRPPNNRVPAEEEVENCRGFFERQLEVLQPEFICCLGATAAKTLLHSGFSLGKMRGRFFTVGHSQAIVTYHPAYLLRNPAAKKDTWEDIQLLMRAMGLPTK
ncbi:MAG: uracil-DNA glycosylase family protein [Planctomycetota bacterium]